MTRNWRPGLEAARVVTTGHLYAVTNRLAKRPGLGATIATVADITDDPDYTVSSRLAQRVRKGTLFKAKPLRHKVDPARYFLTRELLLAFLASDAGAGYYPGPETRRTPCNNASSSPPCS